jgi:plastocyanin
MKGRGSLVLTVALSALLLLAFGPGTGLGLPGDVTTTQDVPARARVLVQDNYFEPRSVEVLDEGQVTWRWRGKNKHSIRFTKVPGKTSRKGAKLRVKGKWKRTFHKPGVYRYVCTMWSGMRGSVSVRKAPPPPPET